MESSETPTILVVDDDPDVLRLVESVLISRGYDVVLTRGAEGAIRAFRDMARKPDLVLTDVVMPGKSGPMLVDELLAEQPGLRVLFMSGFDERQIVQRYVIERGFALVAKPFTLKRLEDAVKTALSAPLPAVSEPVSPEATSS